MNHVSAYLLECICEHAVGVWLRCSAAEPESPRCFGKEARRGTGIVCLVWSSPVEVVIFLTPFCVGKHVICVCYSLMESCLCHQRQLCIAMDVILA